MHLAFIGLGSNLGNERNGIFESPKKQLLNAIQSIDNQITIHLLRTSHFYQTQAIGPAISPTISTLPSRSKQVLAPINYY